MDPRNPRDPRARNYAHWNLHWKHPFPNIVTYAEGRHPPACELDVVMLSCGTLVAVHPADLVHKVSPDMPLSIGDLEFISYDQLNDLVQLRPRVEREIDVPRIQPLEVALENALRNDWHVLLEIKGSAVSRAEAVGQMLAKLLHKTFGDLPGRPKHTTVASFSVAAMQGFERAIHSSARSDAVTYAMFWPSSQEFARSSALSETAIEQEVRFGVSGASWTSNGLRVARNLGLVPIVHASAVEEAAEWMRGEKPFGCYKVVVAEAEFKLSAGASFVISEPSSYL